LSSQTSPISSDPLPHSGSTAPVLDELDVSLELSLFAVLELLVDSDELVSPLLDDDDVPSAVVVSALVTLDSLVSATVPVVASGSMLVDAGVMSSSVDDVISDELDDDGLVAPSSPHAASPAIHAIAILRITDPVYARSDHRATAPSKRTTRARRRHGFRWRCPLRCAIRPASCRRRGFS
jgi:hypothetical protein